MPYDLLIELRQQSDFLPSLLQHGGAGRSAEHGVHENSWIIWPSRQTTLSPDQIKH
jgi:hypothetical protein